MYDEHKAMRTISVGRTDVGRRRPHNEDAFLSDDELALYVVCDGVGGNAKGEVASAESVELVHSWVRRWRPSVDAFVTSPSRENEGTVRRLIESAVQSACYMVFGMGQQDPRQKGMSSTLSALLCAGGMGFIAQVGDSRVYLSRKRDCVQLTEDHTLINFRLKLGLITPEEAATAPGKNVITRAVGHQDYVEVDTITLPLELGDRFLLCSDGLHGYLEDGELEDLMPGDRVEVVERLIELANERGGRDNITAVICDVVS
jgi:serine/threonine protein phosphatase PrpC